MLTYADGSSVAAEWLATADDAPDRVQLWWANAGIALLAVGMQWEAVKTDAERGRHAVTVGTLDGPIMCDPVFGDMYFLVAIGTFATWDVAGTECLSGGCWLKVPAPHCTSPPGAYWFRAPDGSGTLVDAAALRSALNR